MGNCLPMKHLIKPVQNLGAKKEVLTKETKDGPGLAGWLATPEHPDAPRLGVLSPGQAQMGINQ